MQGPALPTDPLDAVPFTGEPAVPAFGTAGRASAVSALLAYRPVWRQAYAWAQRVTATAATPYDVALMLERKLRASHPYDGSSTLSPNDPDALARWIVSGAPGYCQMFSASMTELLRLLGVPARVVEGFTTGTYDTRTSSYVVDDRDAHAWVEAWLPGAGWVPFDPTPGRYLPNQASSSSHDGAAATRSSTTKRVRTGPGVPATSTATHASDSLDLEQGLVARRGQHAALARRDLRGPRPRGGRRVASPPLRWLPPRVGRSAIRGRALACSAGRPRSATWRGVDARGDQRPARRRAREPPRSRCASMGRCCRSRRLRAARRRGRRAPDASRRDRAAPPRDRLGASCHNSRVTELDLYELYQEGRARLARGDTAQALVPLERARNAAPDQASIREALGCAYLRLRRFREAEAEFEAMLELAPNDHYAYYGLGRAREALGQRALARGHYRIATVLRPSCDDYQRALERVV